MNTEKLALYLCLSAINNTSPSADALKGADIKELYRCSAKHKVTALVCYALEKIVQVPVLFSEAKTKAVRKDMLLDAELQKISAFLQGKGIFYMPLKGALLKEYYPNAGMRQMSDVDIFYDFRFREEIREYMLEKGYECIAFTEGQDAYKRQPVYNFEFHHLLFSPLESEVFYDYYKDIKKRLVKDSENPLRYNMSKEDFYIYLIAHEFKHFSQFGTGIRSLLDVIVFTSKFWDSLDMKYVHREFEKLNLSEFEEKQRALCNRLAEDNLFGNLSVEDEELLSCFLSTGVYGDYRTGVANRITGKAGEKDREFSRGKKIKYIIRRVFPPLEYYRAAYPFFYKHKILIPFCVFYRIFSALFKRNAFVRAELDTLKKTDKLK